MKNNYLFSAFVVCCLCFASVFTQDTATTVMPVAKGLSCYVCDSADPNHGDKCSDENILKYGNEFRKNCSDIGDPHPSTGYTMCRKIRQWVDYEFEGLRAYDRVRRTCGYEKTDRACYYRAGYGGRVDVCTCEQPNCNGASTIAFSSILVILLVAVTRL